MKLALGTVQFGLNYGISNQKGRTNRFEAAEILKLSNEHNIDLLDTAPSYGGSESVIGSILGETKRFKIVTKTPVFKGKSTSKSFTEKIKLTYYKSLEALKQDCLYSLLIHDIGSLMDSRGEQLYKVIEGLKSEGVVRKIGVSVYNPCEVDFVLENFDIDLVQLPINIFDQRFHLTSTLSHLKKKGVEIHARSIFLQGLLFIENSDLSDYFAPIKSIHKTFRDYLKDNNLTPAQLALAYVNSLSEIDRYIVGVNSKNQLTELIDAIKGELKIDFKQFNVDDQQMINPSLWPK